jgi:acyl-[acyl-carrier-protein] desaturase
MATLQAGFDPQDKPLLHAFVYVSFQEMATRVSHRNAGRACEDSVAERLLARIAMDENLHMIFYRNIVEAALEIAPCQTMRAIADEAAGFEMPGSVIPGFGRKAVQIAQAGIYDLRIHHDDVIMPLVRYWRIFERTGLGAEGEQARHDLAATLEVLDARASRFAARRAEAKEQVRHQRPLADVGLWCVGHGPKRARMGIEPVGCNQTAEVDQTTACQCHQFHSFRSPQPGPDKQPPQKPR